MLGIYGGTFDPIHHGHLRTALEVREALGLAEVRFIPCGYPSHRWQPEASSEMRLRMLELALQGAGPEFKIDTRELMRKGPSYMVDTLQSLRIQIANAPLALIVGLDAFQGFSQWHSWRSLFDLAHVIVMHRPNADETLADPVLSEFVQNRVVGSTEMLHTQPAGRVHFIEVTQLAISASRIRELVRQGRSPRYLLPESVLGYIQAQGLYAGSCVVAR